jgi:hypothetical protein
MDKNNPYFCSELVALRVKEAGVNEAEVVANLETIDTRGCTVSAEMPVVAGTAVAMQCLECPAGHRSCKSCCFAGRIRSVRQDELGVRIEVEFAGRTWGPEQWRPRHLTEVPGESSDA